MNALQLRKISEGKYLCELDLKNLFQTTREWESFESKWPLFLASDEWNEKVIERSGEKISYPHKSWIPDKDVDKPKILVVGGNPAPHSVFEDIYFAYEITGSEHRFWKVLRELEIIDLAYDLSSMRDNFFSLNYSSPFVLGLEAVMTFPSSASAPKWSGVQGLINLFGKKAFERLYKEEKSRIRSFAQDFFKDSGGVIIAMQKHAFEALADTTYSVKDAVESRLRGQFSKQVEVFGTPPTRWLYTKKMKLVLQNIAQSAKMS